MFRAGKTLRSVHIGLNVSLRHIKHVFFYTSNNLRRLDYDYSIPLNMDKLTQMGKFELLKTFYSYVLTQAMRINITSCLIDRYIWRQHAFCHLNKPLCHIFNIRMFFVT